MRKTIEYTSVIGSEDLTIEYSLKKNGFIISTINGISMLPTIRQNRDRVIIENYNGLLKKNDVVLYKRWDGKYVIHRIIEVGENAYTIRGDNTYVEEYVPFERVLGIMTHFIRDEKMIDVTDEKYVKYVYCLYKSYPFRKQLWKCHVIGSKVKRIIQKTVLFKKKH